jgi:hypothetical protein
MKPARLLFRTVPQTNVVVIALLPQKSTQPHRNTAHTSTTFAQISHLVTIAELIGMTRAIFAPQSSVRRAPRPEGSGTEYGATFAAGSVSLSAVFGFPLELAAIRGLLAVRDCCGDIKLYISECHAVLL